MNLPPGLELQTLVDAYVSLAVPVVGVAFIIFVYNVISQIIKKA